MPEKRGGEFLRGLAWNIPASIGAPADLAETVLNLGLAGGGYLGHKLGLLRADQLPQLLEGSPGTTKWWAKGTPMEESADPAFVRGQLTGGLAAAAYGMLPQMRMRQGQVNAGVPSSDPPTPKGSSTGKASDNTLYAFGTSWRNKVQQRVGEAQAAAAIRDWAYSPGAQLLSEKTGKTLTIKERYVDAKGVSRYLVEAVDPKTGDFDRGLYREDALLADKNLRPLNQQPADAESVRRLLQGLAKP